MKNELKNRREFFKEAARKALPILGAVALMSNLLIAKAVKNEQSGCYYSCEHTCSGSCAGTCNKSCKESCSGSCRGTCMTSCRNTCAHLCTNSSHIG